MITNDTFSLQDNIGFSDGQEIIYYTLWQCFHYLEIILVKVAEATLRIRVLRMKPKEVTVFRRFTANRDASFD